MKKKLIIIGLILVMSTGCSLPGLGGNAKNNDIVIASGNTTERQILTGIVSQMIQHHLPHINVDQINNLGSTLLIFQTLTRKDTNIASGMYTGTSLTGELGLPPTNDTEAAFWSVVEGYYNRFDMVWFPSYGFSNTYAFMVSREFAERENIKTVSDLGRVAGELRAGVDTSWIDRQGDGYEAFKEIYGFDFGQLYPMEIGLVYNAVLANEMDVVLGYSTDGRIEAYDLVLLEDDLHLFPPYDASPLITKEALERYPEIEAVLLKLENSIDQSTMQRLNRLSDEQRVEPSVVAQQFLEENNYFEDVNGIPLAQREQYQAIMEGGQ